MKDDPKKRPNVKNLRKFSDLDPDEQKRLRHHVNNSIADQRHTAQRLIEDFKRQIVTANTGGVAATIALIAQRGVSKWFIGGVNSFCFGQYRRTLVGVKPKSSLVLYIQCCDLSGNEP